MPEVHEYHKRSHCILHFKMERFRNHIPFSRQTYVRSHMFALAHVHCAPVWHLRNRAHIRRKNNVCDKFTARLLIIIVRQMIRDSAVFRLFEFPTRLVCVLIYEYDSLHHCYRKENSKRKPVRHAVMAFTLSLTKPSLYVLQKSRQLFAIKRGDNLARGYREWQLVVQCMETEIIKYENHTAN